MGGLKRQYPELSARQCRDACSEKYRVKVHRLSFGINDKMIIPNYDQLVKDMTSGRLDVTQRSQMEHQEARSKGKGKSRKGKSRWMPKVF